MLLVSLLMRERQENAALHVIQEKRRREREGDASRREHRSKPQQEGKEGDYMEVVWVVGKPSLVGLAWWKRGCGVVLPSAPSHAERAQ